MSKTQLLSIIILLIQALRVLSLRSMCSYRTIGNNLLSYSPSSSRAVFMHIPSSNLKNLLLNVPRLSYSRLYSSSPVSTNPAVVPPEWTSSRIIQNNKNAEGLRLIDIEVSDDIGKSYIHPG